MREGSAEMAGVGGLRRQNNLRPLHDAADGDVQRAMVALEQLEAGREPGLRPPKYGK